MHRSKQQAIAFLLGALLVGAVLGFSADRMMGGDGHGRPRSWREARARMYDDLELTTTQRVAMDSVLDRGRREMQEITRPMRPRLDSVRARTDSAMRQILNDEQRARFDERRQRRKDDHGRREGGKDRG